MTASMARNALRNRFGEPDSTIQPAFGAEKGEIDAAGAFIEYCVIVTDAITDN